MFLCANRNCAGHINAVHADFNAALNLARRFFCGVPEIRIPVERRGSTATVRAKHGPYVGVTLQMSHEGIWEELKGPRRRQRGPVHDLEEEGAARFAALLRDPSGSLGFPGQIWLSEPVFWGMVEQRVRQGIALRAESPHNG